MPYFAKKLRNKKIPRKFRSRSTGMSIKTMARVAQKVVNKNIEQKEKKYDFTSVGIDPVSGSSVSLGSVSYGGSSIISGLCRGITTGTGEGSRVGHEITLRGVYIWLAVQCASGTETNNFRLSVIRPKGQISTSSVAALAQQIFSNAGSTATQWLNPIDTDIFKIYYDKAVFIKPSDISGVGNASQRFYKTFIKFGKKGLTMKWNEADSQPFRDLYVVAISDSAALAHPGAIAGFIRLYYKDA